MLPASIDTVPDTFRFCTMDPGVESEIEPEETRMLEFVGPVLLLPGLRPLEVGVAVGVGVDVGLSVGVGLVVAEGCGVVDGVVAAIVRSFTITPPKLLKATKLFRLPTEA